MKTLLWKDYRQNRRVLGAVGIFVLAPYGVVTLFGVGELLIHGQLGVRGGWVEYFFGASIAGLAISMLVCAFIAGNAVAGERADRCAEFAAYLPISRRSAIVSKATLAISVCTLMWLGNGLIFYLTSSMPGYGIDPHGRNILLGMAVSALFLFGVSWLFSTLLNSPALAASAGIVACIVFFMLLAIIDDILPDSTDLEGGFALVCVVLGIGCFVAGVLYYLRRVEP